MDSPEFVDSSLDVSCTGAVSLKTKFQVLPKEVISCFETGFQAVQVGL